MRGAFGQDHEFARKMAVERWRRYRISKSMRQRAIDKSEAES